METYNQNIQIDVIIPYCEYYTPRFMLDRAIKSIEEQQIVTNIILIEDKTPGNIASARNEGLKKSSTRFVAFMDADDIWKPNKLTRQLSEMRKTDSGICVQAPHWITDKDTFIQSLLFGPLEHITSSILIDTKNLDIQFRPELLRFEDHMFMIEAALQSEICFCEDLIVAEKHDGGLSAEGTPELMYTSKMIMADIIDQYPGASKYSDRLRHSANYGHGRHYQLQGNLIPAVKYILYSLNYKVSFKSIAALILSPYYLITKSIISRYGEK